MLIVRLLLVLMLTWPIALCAQTITAKGAFGPFAWGIPGSLGTAVEVGISARSSVQLSGFYRVEKTGFGINQGPKFYLDYRWYPNPQNQKNSGFYLSPFVGMGHQRLGDDGDTSGQLSHEIEHSLREQFAGFVLGIQPYPRSSRFSIDVYAGPAYEWRTEHYRYDNSALWPPVSYNRSRIWFKAGLSLCLRIRK